MYKRYGKQRQGDNMGSFSSKVKEELSKINNLSNKKIVNRFKKQRLKF